MHGVVEYGALAGAGWILSNVLFVVVWSWMHSRKRRWMDDPNARISCFSTGQEELLVDALQSPAFVASMQALQQSEMAIDKAS
jgi:hypothetical protein